MLSREFYWICSCWRREITSAQAQSERSHLRRPANTEKNIPETVLVRGERGKWEMEKGSALEIGSRSGRESFPAANSDNLSRFLRLSSELCQKLGMSLEISEW